MENDKTYLDRFHGRFLENSNDQLPSTSTENNFCSSFLMVEDNNNENNVQNVIDEEVTSHPINEETVGFEQNLDPTMGLSSHSAVNDLTLNPNNDVNKVEEKKQEKTFVENVVSYLTNQNKNFQQNSNEEEKNKKYLYRLITYLMKENPIARAIFEEGEIDGLNSNDLTKFTKIIMNANSIINLDTSSKYQLTLVYRSLNGIINSITKEIPDFNAVWQSLSTAFHSQYEMCLNKDYQVCQLHYLANCGNLEDPVGEGDKITPLSRTYDFLQQMLVPIGLTFSQFTVNILLNIYKGYTTSTRTRNKLNNSNDALNHNNISSNISINNKEPSKIKNSNLQVHSNYNKKIKISE